LSYVIQWVYVLRCNMKGMPILNDLLNHYISEYFMRRTIYLRNTTNDCYNLFCDKASNESPWSCCQGQPWRQESTCLVVVAWQCCNHRIIIIIY